MKQRAKQRLGGVAHGVSADGQQRRVASPVISRGASDFCGLMRRSGGGGWRGSSHDCRRSPSERRALGAWIREDSREEATARKGVLARARVLFSPVVLISIGCAHVPWTRAPSMMRPTVPVTAGGTTTAGGVRPAGRVPRWWLADQSLVVALAARSHRRRTDSRLASWRSRRARTDDGRTRDSRHRMCARRLPRVRQVLQPLVLVFTACPV
jgi:hypothetical protein